MHFIFYLLKFSSPPLAVIKKLRVIFIYPYITTLLISLHLGGITNFKRWSEEQNKFERQTNRRDALNEYRKNRCCRIIFVISI